LIGVALIVIYIILGVLYESLIHPELGADCTRISTATSVNANTTQRSTITSR